MPVPSKPVTNANVFLVYPPLPDLPSDASEELRNWNDALVSWYDDFRRVLQRDRDEILAKINELS